MSLRNILRGVVALVRRKPHVTDTHVATPWGKTGWESKPAAPRPPTPKEMTERKP